MGKLDISRREISIQENKIGRIKKTKAEELLKLLEKGEFGEIKFIKEIQYNGVYYGVFQYNGKQFIINNEKKVFSGLEYGIHDAIVGGRYLFGKEYLRYVNENIEYLVDQDGKSCPGLEKGYKLYDNVKEVEYFKKLYVSKSDIEDRKEDKKGLIDVTRKIEYRGKVYIKYARGKKEFLIDSNGKSFPGLEKGFDKIDEYTIDIFGKEYIQYTNGEKNFLIDENGTHFSLLKKGADKIYSERKFYGKEYMIYGNNNTYFAIDKNGKHLPGLEKGSDHIMDNQTLFGKEYVIYSRNRKRYVIDQYGNKYRGLEGGFENYSLYETKIFGKKYVKYQKGGEDYLLDEDGISISMKEFESKIKTDKEKINLFFAHKA